MLNRRLIDTEFETESGPEQQKALGKNKLVNILNLRHFKNKSLFVHFLHTETGRNRAIEAIPQPCLGKYLVCLWRNPPDFPANPEKSRLTGFSFSNGIELIHAETQLRSASTKGICVVLPEKVL